jgi:hypothetical protein
MFTLKTFEWDKLCVTEFVCRQDQIHLGSEATGYIRQYAVLPLLLTGLGWMT